MQLLAFILVYPILWVVSVLPFPVFYALSDVLYFLVYRVMGYRKKVVRKNLELSFPEYSAAALDKIESRFYRHMVDLFLEMIKSMSISRKQLQKRFQYTNLEVLTEYEKQGKSIVLLAGHYASYEWLVSLGDLTTQKAYAIYSPLMNPYFDRLVKRIRSRFDAYLLNRYKTLETVKEHLKEGIVGVYGFANDQSPQPHKAYYWRPFMGVTVPVFTYAEVLAKELNLPVLYVGVEKLKRGHYQATFTVITDDPLSYPDYEITDRYYDILEADIRKDPAYYLWSHNRFKHRDKAPEQLKR